MIKIILFYKYIDLPHAHAVMKWQKKFCKELQLKGRIILASEGINGTLGGSAENIDRYMAAMREHPLFCDIDFKESTGADDYFPRLRIVVKKEIVYLGIDSDTLKARDGGIHLEPEQAHSLIAKKPEDLVIVDCRNSYESKIGAFENAVRPEVAHFRDFPAYVDENINLFKDKQVLLYCTGGVRCERGSAYIKSKSVAKEVYQIKGGIQRYCEQFPNGFFRGKNYVFDGRIAVPITQDILSSCFICQKPCDEYNNCLNASCNRHFIGCAQCLAQYQNTCGQVCHELVYVKMMPKRPPLKPRRAENSSCGI